MTPQTIVCVHAHPDDEALFTAGATSYCADQGHRLVLITCTYGQLGIDGAGRPGNAEGHDDLGTRATRAMELQRAGELCGFARQVSLGYLDSGMVGWSSYADPHAFVNVDVERAARQVAAVLDAEEATVVITYDENGFYGHPDHVTAHRVTRRAVELSTSAQRLFYPVIPRPVISEFVRRASEEGVFMPAWVSDATLDTDEDQVAVRLDVRDRASLKQRAIALHASQIDNADLVSMSSDLFELLFGVEYYRLGWSRGACTTNNDLLGGLS